MEVDDALLVDFRAHEHVEMMVLLYVEEIVERVRPCVVGVVGLSEVCLGYVVVHDVRLEGVCHGIDERGGVVDTEVGTEHEALERLDVDVGVSEQSPIVEVVVLVMVKLTQGVLAVAHATDWSGERGAVCLIHWHRRRHLQGVLHWCRVHLLGVRQREVLAHGHHLADVERSVHTCREALEIGILQYALVVLVAQ